MGRRASDGFYEPRGLDWRFGPIDQQVLDLLQNPKHPEDLTIDRADMPTTSRLIETAVMNDIN